MRDILEDAEGAAERGDVGPGKANRERDKPSFPKRFYKTVKPVEQEEGFAVTLDDRVVKTPGRQVLLLPNVDVAQLVSDEWDAIEGEINPLQMPVTRLTNTAVDGIANEMQAVMEDIVRYAGSDLLCYRADKPQGLVDKQREYWDPIIDWADEELGARFDLAEGVMHITQPKEAISAYSNALKAHADPFKLACLHTFTTLSGSALLALGLTEQRYSLEQAWAAAHVDEDWNISLWGEDFEAAERRKQRHKDFEAAHKLLIAIG